VENITIDESKNRFIFFILSDSIYMSFCFVLLYLSI
jgi:hypothetical protein